MKTPDMLAETSWGDDPVLAVAAPMRLGAIAAHPGWVPGAGVGLTAIEIVEIIRLLRVGSMVGLAFALTTVPPRPSLVRLAPDMVMVANWRPGLHAFYLQGADGLWRRSPVVGQGTPDGALVADLPALARGYGHPLPPSVLGMARPRPAGVPAALQATASGMARAMANAPDPCKDLPGQRHHMVPASLMKRHETFLTRIVFTLDHGANLINLPSTDAQRTGMSQLCRQNRPIHSGRTAARYENAVSDRLNRIEGDLNAGRITPEQAGARVRRLMDMIRSELESGRHANVNDPGLADAIARMVP